VYCTEYLYDEPFLKEIGKFDYSSCNSGLYGIDIDHSLNVLQHLMLTREANLINLNLLTGSVVETYRWFGYVVPHYAFHLCISEQ
jgi:hypothetical protein